MCQVVTKQVRGLRQPAPAAAEKKEEDTEASTYKICAVHLPASTQTDARGSGGSNGNEKNYGFFSLVWVQGQEEKPRWQGEVPARAPEGTVQGLRTAASSAGKRVQEEPQPAPGAVAAERKRSKSRGAARQREQRRGVFCPGRATSERARGFQALGREAPPAWTSPASSALRGTDRITNPEVVYAFVGVEDVKFVFMASSGCCKGKGSGCPCLPPGPLGGVGRTTIHGVGPHEGVLPGAGVPK
jgi:hypothetical protein